MTGNADRLGMYMYRCVGFSFGTIYTAYIKGRKYHERISIKIWLQS